MSEPENPPGGGAPVKEGDILASKYRVEKVLGVGGMGVVVAAHHVDLDEKVALKFLLPHAAANGDLVGRFLREARASVRLKGRHVAKVLDVGRLEDGAPYIVMEFLEGADLMSVIRSSASSSPIAIEDAVSYLLHAAEGLAEAHALGIIHRDLKPGNLFLTRGVDARPLVKVLDFGISKTIDRSITGEGASLTKTETLLGSPLYMSPEQMRSSKNVDERADIWALGVILYELLTGKLPFVADTIMGLCFAVAQEQPRDPKKLRADLPDGLCEVVLKCLEKDPRARYANVADLADALEPYGPMRDSGTAERTRDVLGTRRRMVSDVELPKVAFGGEPTLDVSGGASAAVLARDATPASKSHSSLAKSVGDAARTMASAVGVGVSESSAPDEAPTSSAWGATRAEGKAATPERSNRGRIGAAVAVACVGIAGVVLAVTYMRGPASAEPHDATGSAVATNKGVDPPAAATLVGHATSSPVRAEGSDAPPATSAPSASASAEAVAAVPAASATTIARASGGGNRAPAPAKTPKAAPAPSASARPPAPAVGTGFIRERE